MDRRLPCQATCFWLFHLQHLSGNHMHGHLLFWLLNGNCMCVAHVHVHFLCVSMCARVCVLAVTRAPSETHCDLSGEPSERPLPRSCQGSASLDSQQCDSLSLSTNPLTEMFAKRRGFTKSYCLFLLHSKTAF